MPTNWWDSVDVATDAAESVYNTMTGQGADVDINCDTSADFSYSPEAGLEIQGSVDCQSEYDHNNDNDQTHDISDDAL